MYASMADRPTRQLIKRRARLDVLSDRRTWVFESETGAVEHFLQADGRALPPAFHHHPTNLVYDEWPNLLASRPMVEALLSRL
jgi:hypothetical protein